jgi:hypothetical protein
VVELGVVQAIEQVHGAGARSGDADAEAAGELRIADCLERAHLLMPGLDELQVGLGPAPGGENAVDAVTREAEHLVDSPFAQAAKQVVGDSGSGHRRFLLVIARML